MSLSISLLHDWPLTSKYQALKLHANLSLHPEEDFPSGCVAVRVSIGLQAKPVLRETVCHFIQSLPTDLRVPTLNYRGLLLSYSFLQNILDNVPVTFDII